MTKDIFKKFIFPVSLLSGTIIGAGIFSLPFIFSCSGVLTSFVFLIVLCFAFIFIHLIYADIVLKNGTQHRFAGYAKIYFGQLGNFVGIIMTILQGFLVLSIYLLLSSSFFSSVLPSFNPLWGVLLFWLIGSIICSSGTKKITFFEFLSVLGILSVILVLCYLGFDKFFNHSLNLISSNWKFWLLPFGALLFSLSGRPSIPSLVHYFEKINPNAQESKKEIRRAIVWGTIMPAIVYGIFIISILGLSPVPSPDTFTGIMSVIPSWVLMGLGALGLISLISSYFAIGVDLKHSLQFDLGLSRISSLTFIFFIPPFLYYMKIGGLISLIEIAGGIFIGLESLMILLMWRKSRKIFGSKNSLIKENVKIIFWFLFSIFIIGVCYAIWFGVFPIR